jgi:hypothetical protein
MPKLPLSLLIFTVGAFVRATYSFLPYFYLNWDEAPQAHMAQRIAAGHILPLVHFQLPYIGAVEQYPLALAMLVFGDDVITLRLFYFGLSLFCLATVIIYHGRILQTGWAVLANVFFALSPPLVLLYSVQSYSFGGLMAFSALLLLGLSYLDRPRLPWYALFAIGLLNGLSLYNNILSLGLLMFSAWSVIATRRPDYLRHFATGFSVGYAPMLGFNLANDFVSYKMLVAKFLGVTRYMVEEQGVFGAIVNGFATKVTGQGPSGLDIESLYTLPMVFSHSVRPLQTAGFLLIAAIVALAYSTLLPKFRHWPAGRALYDNNTRLAYYASTGLLLVVALGQARYMSALLPVLPLVLCEGVSTLWKKQKHLATLATAFLVFYLAFAHIAAYAQLRVHPKRDNIRLLHEKLVQKGLQYGYGSYEYQTSIAFISRDKIKLSTQIGPTYMDKIPRFSQIVDQQEQVFYILPADSSYIRPLIDRKITYQIEAIPGAWTPGAWLLWDFSERVYPLDLLSQDELARPDGYYRWSYREMPAVLNPYRGGH